MNPNDLNRTLRRPQKYWNIDGLPLLGMGALWLALGAGSLLVDSAEGYWKLAGVPLLLFFLGATCWLNKILKKIKRRITEPRTGAVRGRPAGARRVGAMVFLAALAMAAGVVVVRQGLIGEVQRALPAAVGLAIAGAFFYASWRYELQTYALVGLVALVTGLGLSIRGAAFNQSLDWFFIAIGLVSMLGGARDLRAYLKAHPKPAAAEGVL